MIKGGMNTIQSEKIEETASTSIHPSKKVKIEGIADLGNEKEPVPADIPIVEDETSNDNLINLIASWNGKKYPVVMRSSSTLLDLKHILAQETCVPVHRQKLLGLLRGKLPPDDHSLESLGLKKHETKSFMMMGSVDEVMLKEKEEFENLPDVVNDLDFDYYRVTGGIAPADDPENQKALLKTMEKSPIILMNEPRPGKKLLVLDLDYTLFDCKSPASHISELQRPGMHSFLSTMYMYYDLVIWSQTSRRWLDAKLTELGILTHPEYQLLCVMDRTTMFSVTNQGRRDKEGAPTRHEVKALSLLWKSPLLKNAYSEKNTIHVDDLSRNFAMNPKNGLKISAFKNAHVSRATDHELRDVGRYLLQLTLVDDFSTMNHGKFRKFDGILPDLPPGADL